MKIKLTTLSENTAGRVGLLAEWGLSILVEVDDYKILLDTGLGVSAACNAAFLGIDLSSVYKIVISHGHRDHTGGMVHVLNAIKREIDIIAHPDIWASKYSGTFGTGKEYAGIPFAREALESLGANFVLTKEPVWISDNIVTSGEIPMRTEYENIDAELYVKDDEIFQPDSLWDDLALFIKTGIGLVIVLGCGHRGIINTLYHAQELTGVERIHMVVGGTHLIRASRERMDLTVAELKRLGVHNLGVSHCTGLPAATILSQEFGDSFFFNNTGRRITIQDD